MNRSLLGMPLLAVGLVLADAMTVHAADDPYGAQLYAAHCAQCHEQTAEVRAPPRAALEKLSPTGVQRALETGPMREVGATLTSGERLAVSQHVGKAESVTADPSVNRCAAPHVTSTEGWTGWSTLPDNWRFQTTRGAGLRAADVSKLRLKWAFGIPEATTLRSQPAAFDGRVFVAGPASVHSLDAKTGCTFWSVSVPSQIRSGVTIAPLGPRSLVIFGDANAQLHALDAATGEPAWDLRVDEHPAATVSSTPLYYDGKLYFGVSSFEETVSMTPGYACCTFRGSVQAVDAATGRLLWKTYTVAEEATPRQATRAGNATFGPSGAGVWSTPTLDARKSLLYVTTGDNYSEPTTGTSDAVLALSLGDGRIVWSRQLTEGDAYNSSCRLLGKPNCPDADGPDFDFGSSAMLLKLASRRVLAVGQKSGMLHALDPDQHGEILWQARAGHGGRIGGIQWGSATDGKVIYVAVSDMSFTEETATGTKPDPTRGGGMFAFRADDGKLIWMSAPPACGDRSPCSPAQSGAVSAMPGIVFSGSYDGHFRAYDTHSGKIVFDFDTVRDYKTVNGVQAKGGALDAGGPVIASGRVFVNSGYARWGGISGNVVLAFGVD